ncbi:MAG: succinyl-diaminopimelate desuccinylase [Campylobacterales bacterium]|nr:succinyl-diaminopimelate desuccinylase [Campylobacterales bacterium]
MQTLELFKYMLTCKSETPDDGGLLDFIASYLPDFSVVRVDEEGVKNLFLYRCFGDGPHLCFAGHVDVVPAGEGWSSDPYMPIERDGVIYGRGAQDMKSGVAAFTQALKETQSFNGTLSLLLTSDEEGPAKHGTVAVLKHLETIGMLPDAVVVAEPTCEERFGDAIKIGRRGSINGVIEIRGRQGHAAYPEKSINPIDLIAPRLTALAGVALDDGDAFFAPSRMVLTDIRSGMEVTNVTPGRLKLMFNVRNSTKTSKASIEAYVRRQLEGLDFTLNLDQSAAPFVTDAQTGLVRTLDAAIIHVMGISPKYSTAGGTSDARFIAPYGIDVVEFGVRNNTIHAPNEHVNAEDVLMLKEVFSRFISKFLCKI